MQENAFLSGGILCYTGWLEINYFGLILKFYSMKSVIYFIRNVLDKDK